MTQRVVPGILYILTGVCAALWLFARLLGR
jgi:hypothetical protein